MPITHPLRFPRDFVWGVATAAPQIEGAAFDLRGGGGDAAGEIPGGAERVGEGQEGEEMVVES